MRGRVRRDLICCICGADAGRFVQHPGRDTGFGICRGCADGEIRRGTDPQEMLDLYGAEGVNYAAHEAHAAQIHSTRRT